MKIGVFATFMSPNATPTMIKDFGKRAEGMGLDSIWMGEHVALFEKNTFGYPGSKDGRIPVPPYHSTIPSGPSSTWKYSVDHNSTRAACGVSAS